MSESKNGGGYPKQEPPKMEQNSAVMVYDKEGNPIDYLPTHLLTAIKKQLYRKGTFVMWNFDLCDKLAELEYSSKEIKVLMFLVRRVQFNNRIKHFTQSELAKDAEMSQATVSRSLEKFLDDKLIRLDGYEYYFNSDFLSFAWGNELNPCDGKKKPGRKPKGSKDGSDEGGKGVENKESRQTAEGREVTCRECGIAFIVPHDHKGIIPRECSDCYFEDKPEPTEPPISEEAPENEYNIPYGGATEYKDCKTPQDLLHVAKIKGHKASTAINYRAKDLKIPCPLTLAEYQEIFDKLGGLEL